MSRLNQLLTLARSLPPTPMRVAGSPQLSDAIEAIANRSFPTQPSTSASTSALPPSGSPAAVTQAGNSNTTGPVGSQPSTPEVTLGPGEERAIDGMIQVIQRLKSDQHARQYPLSNRLLRPAQDPVYYKRLVDGVYLAKQGKKRSFWKRFFQVRGEA